MSLKKTVGEKLKEAIGDQSVRSWALDRGLDVRLVARVVAADHAATLDTLEEIAQAAGLSVAQLVGGGSSVVPDRELYRAYGSGRNDERESVVEYLERIGMLDAATLIKAHRHLMP